MLHLRLHSLHSNELAGLELLAPRAHDPRPSLHAHAPHAPHAHAPVEPEPEAPLPPPNPHPHTLEQDVQRPGPLASCRVGQCLGAANTLRDMPIRTCPSPARAVQILPERVPQAYPHPRLTAQMARRSSVLSPSPSPPAASAVESLRHASTRASLSRSLISGASC